MADRPHMSITLPRNFTFHYQDGQAPRTPEPEPQPDELQPPGPPRQMLRVRRRRTAFPFENASAITALSKDLPIPTIEGPEIHNDESMGLPEILTDPVDEAYLAPALAFGRIISPPKTPEAQMRTIDLCGAVHWDDMDRAYLSESSSRPTSSSSSASGGSFDSFQSLGGSCTSPEEEMSDPFTFYTPKFSGPRSPLATRRFLPQKQNKMKVTWSDDMDYHLWMTYLKYLQDPTVTPFKALPSTVPPNGVCHRVARMARKTWKGARATSATLESQHAPRSGTPDTIRPSKSGSNTPLGASRKACARFPSEKQCRKRLRELARRKPTLSAHYQRLMQARSPSPFPSSPQPQPESSQSGGLSSPFVENTTSFSTRDMNVSLTASTAASMQFGNPLSQLANDETPRARGNEWAPGRSSAHQKSQSLHIGLGIGNVAGSSFAAMSHMTDMSLGQHNAQTWHPMSASHPGLGPPVELHSPKPISRPFKRRALHNFDDDQAKRGSSLLEQIFGAPAESSHRRVRSRGFSLGDMGEGARRLNASPPSATATPFASFVDVFQQPSPVSSEMDQGQATVRLGSPFGGRSSNTFPRAATSHGFEAPASFEQRFSAFPSDPSQL